MAARELKQIERQLILYDIFQQNDEDTRLDTIMYHLPGINVRTLQRDIKDLTAAGLLQVYFSRDKNAYINYDEYRDERYGIDNDYGIFKSKNTGKMMYHV